MNLKKTTINILTVLTKLVRYNLKIIFSGKFIYFLMAALFIFGFITVLNLFDPEAQLTEADMFWLLLVPGILLIFYPVTFGIQNDVDNRMLEIIFGIPNYRYKVSLFRLLLIFAVSFAMLLLLSLFSSYMLSAISVGALMFQLMFPILFIGSLAFLVSTIVKDGSGSAVVVLVFVVLFWIGRSLISGYPQWDVFLNPFAMPGNVSELAWFGIVNDNRLYLLGGSIASILFGLINLQKKEKFL